MKNILIIIFFFFLYGLFYKPVLFDSKFPVPSDNLVYLFHPFRDFFAETNPRGVPFKNPLVVDPVTQQIPWRTLVVDDIRNGQFPLWNPFNMTGYPLLGNIQSAPFYPLNILLFLPFLQGWSFFIISQQIMIGIFFYLYARHLKMSEIPSLLGSVAFSFSGFVISWLEWGTIVHTGLWLPLLLLSIDKFSQQKNSVKWLLVFVCSLAFSYLAGHLQTFIYLFAFVFIYTLVFANRKTALVICLASSVTFLVLSPVLLAHITHLLLSARSVDLNWQQPGWFLPWQNLVQFLAPDFFGNPSTGNYFGIWNYGEFVGYIGILPLMLAFISILFTKSKQTLFFSLSLVAALIIMLPHPLSKLPFIFSVPFLSTAQPTRLLFIVDFALCILAVIGFDYLIKTKKRLDIKLVFPLIFIFLLFLLGYFLVGKSETALQFWNVTKRNLILPTALLISSTTLLLFHSYFSEKRRIFPSIIILLVTVLDLLFFANKYTPFVSASYFYPKTSVIAYLQENIEENRIMATDRRIFHPNVPAFYKIQSIDGYDPLYLQRYGELIIAAKRGEADITPPYGFNRIITPNNFENDIVNLLGVKYILTLTDYSSPSLEKVFQEGETRVYLNKNVYPRAFLVENVITARDKKEAISKMFSKDINLRTTAIVEEYLDLTKKKFTSGSAEISSYESNNVKVRVSVKNDGFLILTDSFYPTWRAYINNTEIKIYRTDYNFRGVIVPGGEHVVEFRNTLL